MVNEDRISELLEAFRNDCNKAEGCRVCTASEVCYLIGGDEITPFEWSEQTLKDFLEKK